MARHARQLRVSAALLLVFAITQPALAIRLGEPAPRYHWECVPFAREVSGIQIYGDAWTWWKQAEGRYQRGSRPKLGAVMAFQPHGAMRLGHVATVSEIVDRRTIKVTHANWSRINGRRGQVERDVEVRDVSANGDWSEVRVWYAPSAGLGTSSWPIHGFIYPGSAPRVEPGANQPVITKATRADVPKLGYANILDLKPKRAKPSGRLDYLGKELGRLRD
jgi:surface antigen